MRVELPSLQGDGTHNWVEYRDRLMAIDRFEVQEAVTIEVAAGGGQKYSVGAMQNDMRNALLGKIITAWSFPAPVPSQNSFQAADTAIGSVMDLRDYMVLEKAVQPLLDLIEGRDSPDPKTPNESSSADSST